MTEKNIQEIDLLTEFKPTDFQLEIALNNWSYVIDADNKLSRLELCDFIDSIHDPRIIVMLWMINTCVDGLKEIEDQEQKEHILRECSAYFGQSEDEVLLNFLAQRIISLLCIPIKITENCAFIQIWTEMIEIVTMATEKKYGITDITSDAIDLPFILDI